MSNYDATGGEQGWIMKTIIEFTIIFLIASMITIVIFNSRSTGVYCILAVIGAAILAIPFLIRKLGA